MRPGVELGERRPVGREEVRLGLRAQHGLAEVVGELLIRADRIVGWPIDRDLLGLEAQVDRGGVDDQGAEPVAHHGERRVPGGGCRHGGDPCGRRGRGQLPKRSDFEALADEARCPRADHAERASESPSVPPRWVARDPEAIRDGADGLRPRMRRPPARDTAPRRASRGARSRRRRPAPDLAPQLARRHRDPPRAVDRRRRRASVPGRPGGVPGRADPLAPGSARVGVGSLRGDRGRKSEPTASTRPAKMLRNTRASCTKAQAPEAPRAASRVPRAPSLDALAAGRRARYERENGRWCAEPRSSSTPVRIASARSASSGAGTDSGSDATGSAASGTSAVAPAPGSPPARAQARWRPARARRRSARARRRPPRFGVRLHRDRFDLDHGLHFAPAPEEPGEEAHLRCLAAAGSAASGSGAGWVRSGARAPPRRARASTSASRPRARPQPRGSGSALRFSPGSARPARRAPASTQPVRGQRHLRAPSHRLHLHRAACAIALPGDGGLGVQPGDADLAELAEMTGQGVDVRDLRPQLRRALDEGPLRAWILHRVRLSPPARRNPPGPSAVTSPASRRPCRPQGGPIILHRNY